MVLSSACSGSKSVDANAILSPVNIYKVSFGYINIQTLYLLFKYKNKLAEGRLVHGESVALLNSEYFEHINKEEEKIYIEELIF